MLLEATKIDGLYCINYSNFEDLRGRLFKPFVKHIDNKNISVNLDMKEIWFTQSHRHVIRAMHMQYGNNSCAKFVTLLYGAITDVVLDLRRDSKTFGEYVVFEMNNKQKTAL